MTSRNLTSLYLFTIFKLDTNVQKSEGRNSMFSNYKHYNFTNFWVLFPALAFDFLFFALVRLIGFADFVCCIISF